MALLEVIREKVPPNPRRHHGRVIALRAPMVKFGKTRRSLVAKQLSDVANLALAFGQYIRGQALSALALPSGIALWVVFAALAAAVAGREDQ